MLLATSMARASRVQADASGGAHAVSQARAAGSASSGLTSIPVRLASGGSSGRGGRPSPGLAAESQAGTRPRSRSADLVRYGSSCRPAGAGAEVDQRDLTAGRPGDGRDAQGDLRAPGDLVHLITARPAQAADLGQPGRHKRAGSGLEAIRRTTAGPHPDAENNWPAARAGPARPGSTPRQPRQAGQPVGGQRRQRRQQFVDGRQSA